MSPITVNGLGSSLNIEQIIEETMAVESQSKTRLELRTGEVKARETALQAIKTKLEAVESATFSAEIAEASSKTCRRSPRPRPGSPPN